ncbi:hypothetical protein INT43_002295 [Umbelopsis isabellina]|uniref:Nop domain-containing protein n=1 Tax=Mortierella isabellina TaxID=91625 RepID=A0A8H7UL76_MORIS|nr:hypothetical protein INT43_002295 [Umbelopsis isabellina]
MSLADELAADLDFSDNEVEEDQDQDTTQNQQQGNDDMQTDDAVIEDEDEQRERIESMQMGNVKSVKQISKLLNSKATQDILTAIEDFKKQDRDQSRPISGPIEDDPEYRVIVQSNNLVVELDNEVLTVHKFIRDHYAPKFPELESLVLNPLDYVHAVKTIGNEMDITKVDLHSILPSATIMVVTVTGSTTNGRQLTDEEWKITNEACDMALGLDNARKTIIDYVESRMNFIAPNLSQVVGSATAAKLLGAAGGLTGLCKMPACNVQVLGKNRKTNTGFSRALIYKHGGYIYYSELCSRLPSDLRPKIQKMLAAKCVLAARIDKAHESRDGHSGRTMRDDVENKIEKLQEAKPNKNTKALPVPDEGPKKRRGGRRARKAKEALAMTELRQAQNRMVFGTAEDEAESMGSSRGLGLVGNQVGKIRASAADARSKVKAAKPTKRWGQQSSGTATSGLSTSLSFTPIQGIELADPTAAAEKVKKANERYFGTGAFLNVGKKT